MASNFLTRALSALTRQTQRNVSPRERRDLMDIPGNLWNAAAIATLLDGGTSGSNSSNEIINDFTALNISHVYSCCKILGDNIASLPCKLYKGSGTGTKQLDTASPLSRILLTEFNPETASYTAFQTLMLHLNLRGNAYVEIRRSTSGDVQSLWNLDPRRTEPVRLPQGNQLAYKTGDGMQGGQYRIIAAKDMLHFAINSWDGIQGQSPIACLRETLGLAISSAKYQGRSMVNNAVPSLIVKTTGLALSPEGKTAAREDFEKLNTGASSRRVAILDPGFDVSPLGFNNVDLELLAQRRFTMQEIAAAYGVPAWLLGDTEKLTSASAIQLALAFVQNTLAPICKLIENEMRRKLIPAGSPAHIAFDLRERVKPDFAQMLEAYSVGRQNGFYSTNEIRRELGEDSIGPEGDVYTVQVNMTNLQNMLKVTGEPAPTLDGTSSQFDDDEDDDIDTPSLRSMLPLFRNAVTRTVNGEPAVSVFGPVVESLMQMRKVDDPQLLTDMLTKIEKRSASWGADVEETAEAEMTKSIRSVVFAAHEAAARKELA